MQREGGDNDDYYFNGMLREVSKLRVSHICQLEGAISRARISKKLVHIQTNKRLPTTTMGKIAAWRDEKKGGIRTFIISLACCSMSRQSRLYRFSRLHAFISRKLANVYRSIRSSWGGLVGYDDCLTRSRSRVRFPSRVTFCFGKRCWSYCMHG
jgi:hypothetical protein